MRRSIVLFLVGCGCIAGPLQAQSTGFGLRGFRIEANAGSDRYSAADTRRTKFGYGVTAGVDAEISRIVLGAEASYWRDSGKATDCLTGGAGTFCSSSGRELAGAARAGFEVTPALLLFGKAGVVRTRQREVFTSSGGTFYVNGQFVPGPPSSDSRFNESGYELGGGLEYTLARRVYVDAQYVYSRYRNHTDRDRLIAGLGYRF